MLLDGEEAIARVGVTELRLPEKFRAAAM